MNFLSFFKEIDNKRRTSKRIAINLLYLLLPLVILANSFTSDRIITECEKIDHYNTKLQEEITLINKKCNTSQEESSVEKRKLEEEISELAKERELIKLELAVIDSQRLYIIEGNDSLAVEARRYLEERDQARRDTERLQNDLNILRGKLREEKDRANLCEIQVKKCNADLKASRDDVTRLRGEKGRLEADLAVCNTRSNKLNQDVTRLGGEKDGLEADLKACNTRSNKFEKDLADCLKNASNTDYEVTFSQVLDDSPAFSKPAEHTLLPSYKYEVIVNGETVTYVCPGECSN